MTLPHEEQNSLAQTEELLRDLLRLPRIPKDVRQMAHLCLRHYPNVSKEPGIVSIVELRKRATKP